MAKRTVKKVARTKPAPRYLYVEARGYFAAESTINGDTVNVLDGPISFDSIIVRAANDDEAYNVGAAKLQDQQANDPEMFNQDPVESDDNGEDLSSEPIEGSHAAGRFLNDYVVRL